MCIRDRFWTVVALEVHEALNLVMRHVRDAHDLLHHADGLVAKHHMKSSYRCSCGPRYFEPESLPFLLIDWLTGQDELVEKLLLLLLRSR